MAFYTHIVCFLCLTSACICVAGDEEVPKLYIVYMGASDGLDSRLLQDHHSNMLASVSNSSLESAKESMVLSYTRAINGFAAKILPRQASMLEQMPGIVSVFEDYTVHLQTSHSMSFLGLEGVSGQNTTNSLWRKTMGEDLIIGVIDTGIWPESQSFSDADLPNTIPPKWRGSCVSNFPCNKKIIGARYYGTPSTGPLVPRDMRGHGSHVASIAAGAFVPGTDDKGFARGTVKGVAPRARLAAYKVCWVGTCSGAIVLKAWDDAIGDGVDVINYSIGWANPREYHRDVASIGAFHATLSGISVAASAGNYGPDTHPVGNTAPWITTVAANWMDRRFQSSVVLGDGSVHKGTSITVFDLKNSFYPLAIGADIPSNTPNGLKSAFCSPGSLDPARARGKIILCDRHAGISHIKQTKEIRNVSAIGLIMANTAEFKERMSSIRFDVPGTSIGFKAAKAISKYVGSTRNPNATIQKPETLTGQQPSPMMRIFSSQGPNPLVPDILKPDVTAPGVDILGAWSPKAKPSQAYRLISGTSMASPHVAGLSTLLKSLHPDWSPAAIKSAIMTTAYTSTTGGPILDEDLVVADPFNYGAGHINPIAAADPGLIYDAGAGDYSTFLCNIGYSSSNIQIITGTSVKCPSKKGRATDLNYPSVTLTQLSKSATVTRILTSVSSSASTYRISINPPHGIDVIANPTSLTFSKKGERRSFTLNFVVTKFSGSLRNGYVFGDYVWSDDTHKVRSPIVIHAVKKKSSLLNLYTSSTLDNV